MRDKYGSFSDLSASEQKGAYECRLMDRDSDIVVVAPHGGGIEQGTSEVAEAVAGEEFSLYCFNGKRLTGNEKLHIASTLFDEPLCVDLVERSRVVVAIHGLDGSHKLVYVGGRDGELKAKFLEALHKAGFEVKEDSSHHSGTSPSNICNRGDTGRGVQLEITKGLRRTMFQSLGHRGRRTKKPSFYKFVDVIRNVLLDIRQEAK